MSGFCQLPATYVRLLKEKYLLVFVLALEDTWRVLTAYIFAPDRPADKCKTLHRAAGLEVQSTCFMESDISDWLPSRS